MKKNKLLLIILLLPFSAFCQSLTGLWMGALTNDSSTVRKDESFEMALTEYRGKVYGYSHTTFMVHDTLFYIVKRVKGTIKGDICEVKDDELISCNFMTKMDKGVKQIYTFRLNKADSIWRLDGDWKTTKTKNYYSISGSVKTASEKDLSKSKLYPHLQELNLNDAIASLQPPKKESAPVKQPEKKEPVVVKAEPKQKPENPQLLKPEPTTAPQTDIAKANTTQKEVAKSKPDVEKKKEDTLVKKVTTPVVTDAVATKPKEKTDVPVTSPKDVAKSKPEPEKKKEDILVKKESAPVTTDVVAIKPKEKVDVPVKSSAAVNVEKRKSETTQIVEFQSDSLVLALYDNGEIDGDTVSVLINGEIVMAQQGLKASAIKKTIYITPAMQDSFTLVLYAENLGRYPPNTGLIIVRDGDDSYQVRFSADLQKNVAVLFKRKKK